MSEDEAPNSPKSKSAGGGGTISAGSPEAAAAAAAAEGEGENGEDGGGEVELDEDGNPIVSEEKKEGEDEEEEEEEYSWTLGEDEREIVPKEWVETIVHMALLRYPKVQPLAKRVQKLITEVIRVNACQSNTDTFRGELSMDEVQKIYKQYKPMLMAIFLYYADEVSWICLCCWFCCWF